MGGTTGGPALPQSDGTAGVADFSGGGSSAAPGLPGVGGADGYGGFGRSYLTDSVGPGGANLPHDVETASTFLAHNGFMDAPTREPTDEFQAGLEKLRSHVDKLASGGAPSSSQVNPDGAFELLTQRAVSAGHLSAPEGFGSSAPGLPAAQTASTPDQSPAEQARNAARVIAQSTGEGEAARLAHPPRPSVRQVLAPNRTSTISGLAKPGADGRLAMASAKGQSVARPQSGRSRRTAHSTLPPDPYWAITYPSLPAPASLAKSGATVDPAPDVPFSPAFRNELHMQESAKDGYKAVHYNQEGRATALGRYQLTTTALKDVVLKDKNTGEWTGKYGIRSATDFLNNPRAQELAGADYHAKNIKYLERKGAFDKKGQVFLGVEGPNTITEAGLVAAAHRYGAKNVTDYLEHIFAHSHVSDRSTFPSGKEDAYLAVETRLRKFQKIPLRR